jgi:hypothetical protein
MLSGSIKALTPYSSAVANHCTACGFLNGLALSRYLAIAAVAVTEGFRREGYAVKCAEGAANFELEEAGRLSVVCARQWKASVTRVEPLKELVAAAECVDLSAGEMTGNVRRFAGENRVKVMEAVGLAQLAW